VWADPTGHYDRPVRELTDDDVAQYEENGLIGPFPLVDDKLRTQLIRDSRVVNRRATWYRGIHDFDTSVLRLAQRPDLVAAATRLVSPNLLLWGGELASRVPGRGHPWHNDVESLNGHSLNAWVALQHVSPDTPFLYIPGSHRWGAIPQDHFPDHESEVSDDAILEIARRFDPDARIESITVAPGDLLLFPGNVWHATRNDGRRMRKALILQYCATTTVPRRPMTFQSPVEWHPDPCPCVLVAGRDDEHLNVMAEPAPPAWSARVDGVITAMEEAIRDVILRTKGRTHA
jgi:hypothetical protein